MLRQTQLNLKKGWTYHPGTTQRGAKNMAWRPKMSERRMNNFFPLYVESPSRRPNIWQEKEFSRLGLREWPKEVGFYNAGDNFELTPEMTYRLFVSGNNESYWTPQHNEKTVIALMPLVEKQAPQAIDRVQEVFQHHIKAFGADHCIYNVVMQAYAFAKDLERCKALYAEMKAIGLDPNAQTYVNLMLASKLGGEGREKVEEWFTMAVKDGALMPVVRLDTEFQMWWDQLERMGSFTSAEGFLANNEEGAKAKPTDMWATWGWDRRLERKFVSRNEYIRDEIARRTGSGKALYGSVYQSVKRRPWASYKGLLPYDWSGPNVAKSSQKVARPPAPEHNKVKAGNSY